MRAKEGVFLIGFLFGCLLMNTVLGYKLDHLLGERTALQAALAEKETRLERLEKALESSGTLFIKEIQPHILLKGNRPLQVELEKLVREWLDIFLGRELTSVDPAAIPFIIAERIVTINGRRIQLHVETTIVAEQLTIFIRPEILAETQEG